MHDVAVSMSAAIPQPLLASPLMARGGFLITDGLLERSFQRHLLSEAIACTRQATHHQVDAPDTEEVRGGRPPRQLMSAPGGATQQILYRSPELLRCLSEQVGLAVQPTGEEATFSYYVRPGDHLGLHRDVLACDLALITCLLDQRSSDGKKGGQLAVYPERMFEPLSAIRNSPEVGRHCLHLDPGHSLVLMGGVVPHAVLPVVSGQRRITSLLCFRIYT